MRGVILALLLPACASTGSKADSFDWWTRYYETRMGLPMKTQIRHGPAPAGACGWVGWETQITRHGPRLVLVTVYDPEREGCRPPWSVALHEACHRRMGHHRITRDLIPDFEAEAKQCESWYEEVEP